MEVDETERTRDPGCDIRRAIIKLLIQQSAGNVLLVVQQPCICMLQF